MKRMKVSDVIKVVKPEYTFIKLKPNNSIRNQDTHLIARTISSLYRNLLQNIRKEEEKMVRFLGKDVFLPVKASYNLPGKVSYYIYIEKNKIEFFFIVPSHQFSILKEKMSDVWSNITVEEVKDIPQFSEQSTKYQMVYEKEDALSLRVDRRDSDLLRSNLNVVDVLEEGDKVGVFYNFIPSNQESFRHAYKATIEKVKKNLPVERNKFGLGYVLKLCLSTVDKLVKDISDVLAGGANKKNSEESILESLIEKLNGGNKLSTSTEKKIKSHILDTQILVMSESKVKLRERNNAISLARSFDVLSENNSLVHKSFSKKKVDFTAYDIGVEKNRVGDEEAQSFISLAGRELLEKYNFIDKVDTQETKVPEELRNGVMRIGTSTFRGKKQDAYLSEDKEFKYLSLIPIGPNRAGKSTLIANLTNDALNSGECTIIFDYIGNCELSDEVAALHSKDKVLDIDCNDFETLQGLGYNEVGISEDPFEQYDNAKKQTTQLMTLVNSINTADTHLSPKMERYLTSASLVAFISGGSIKDVFKVLHNHNTRHKFLNLVPENQYENLEESMDSLRELDDYDKDGKVLKGTKLNLIVGIIDRLNKLKANTYMELMLKKSCEDNIDLVEEMQKSQLICIRMPEHMFTTDNEKDVYTTYWITKIWMALQMRKKKFKGDRDKMTKVNLVIDELYQVENTEKFLTTKLSRLPKFNIKPILSCHYLNQIKHIRPELRSANASYMLIAGCDKENFKELQDELRPFDLEDLMNLKRFHSLNLIKTKDGYGRFITKMPAPVSIASVHKEVVASEVPNHLPL